MFTCSKTRNTPACFTQSGDIGITQVFPRHGQRSACPEDKESACGCAGIFNAPYALESYLAVFEEEGALDKFEAFASENGPKFYGLPLNDGTITLRRTGTQVPETLDANGTIIVPFPCR